MCDRPRAVLAVHVRPLARADGADEGVELGLERLVGLDLDLEHVARERRRVAVDERPVGQVRLRERQALGEVVELEHALLADDDELASLGRREPVHVEHPGRARREVQQPEQEVLVGGVLALGELRVDPRRPLAGDPATACRRRGWRGRP